MARLLLTHTMVTAPDYRLIRLGDVENDAGVDEDHAVGQANAAVAGSSGYVLFIKSVQDLLPVSIDVRVWDGAPPTGTGEAVGPFTLEWPSGLISLGSPTGYVTDFELPGGPGVYTLTVSHEGRDEVEARRMELLSGIGPDDDLHALAQQNAGIERYTIDTWYVAPIEDDDEDDDS